MLAALGILAVVLVGCLGLKVTRAESNMQVIEINQTQYEHRHIFTALENAGISRA